MEDLQNPIQQTTVGALPVVDRAAFYRKTYTHLTLSVLLFILVEMILFQIPAVVNFALSLTQGWTWLLLLGGFMFVTNYAEKVAFEATDKNKQYLALLLFVVAEAFIFIPLLYIAIFYIGDGGLNIVSQAGILTGSLFFGLSAIAIMTRKDFSFLKSGLAIAGFVTIGLIVAGTLFGFNLGLWFSAGMILLASGSILYQTSNMVHKYNEEQYVAASLGLFGSLMLLFWYVLSIFSRD